jgi:hypothetical protein
MTLVKVWLGGTLILVLGALVWSFAPILVVVAGVTGGLGLLVAGIVVLARRFERSRNPEN